jgi:hypothetical protein
MVLTEPRTSTNCAYRYRNLASCGHEARVSTEHVQGAISVRVRAESWERTLRSDSAVDIQRYHTLVAANEALLQHLIAHLHYCMCQK